MKGNADMRHRYLLVALSVFVPALTGCSANQTPVIQGPGVQSRSHAVTQTGTGHYKIGKHTLVEADVADNIVNVYDISEKQLKKNPAPIASISDSLDQPYGVALDSSGDLYVANYGNSTVTVYPRGGTRHSSTITTGLSKPLFVAINSDTLYVANNGNGTVTTVYSTGSDSPSQTITGFSSPFGITLDKNGNVYVTDPGRDRRLGGSERVAGRRDVSIYRTCTNPTIWQSTARATCGLRTRIIFRGRSLSTHRAQRPRAE